MIKDLKLRQLRLLVALENEGKLQLAAERLNISQSAASKMLANFVPTDVKAFHALVMRTNMTTIGRRKKNPAIAVFRSLVMYVRMCADLHLGDEPDAQ